MVRGSGHPRRANVGACQQQREVGRVDRRGFDAHDHFLRRWVRVS